MDVVGEIEIEEETDALNINISGENMGVLIGRRGETLNALQYITGHAVNKNRELCRVTIDTENYRKKEETLINLANRLADRAIKYKKMLRWSR